MSPIFVLQEKFLFLTVLITQFIFAQLECPIPNCVWGHPNFYSFFDLVWRGSLESVSTRRINPFSRRVFGRSVNCFFCLLLLLSEEISFRSELGFRVGVLVVKCRRRARRRIRRRRRVGGSRGGAFRDEWEPSTARERLVCVLENPFCENGFFRKEFISFCYLL